MSNDTWRTWSESYRGEGLGRLKTPPASDDAFTVESERRLEDAAPSPHGGVVRSSRLVEESPVVAPCVAHVRKNEVAVIVEVDDFTTQLLGWNSDEMVGRTSLEFIHPDDQQLAVENWMQMLSAHGPGRTVTLRHKHRDGSWISVEMTNHNLLDDPSSNCVVAEMVGVVDDVTVSESVNAPGSTPQVDEEVTAQPRRPHEALRAREQTLHRLAEALPLGVLQVDAEGRIVYSNQRLHAILGVPRAASVEEQFAVVLVDHKSRIDEAFDAVLRGGLDTDIEVCLATSDERGAKEIRQCTMNLRVLTSDTGIVTGAIACVVDVTESVRIREEMRLRATFDGVTGCHNRASTMEHLERALAASDEKSQLAVIFVDLDHFKDVNDRLGHAAGDELLEVVAKRLLRAVRGDDLVGRIGGDEFLVVCPGITSAAGAVQAASRLASALGRPVRLRTMDVACRASLGVAWSGGHIADADALVSQADTAMYESKRLGCGRPVLYRAPDPGSAGPNLSDGH